jgi:hypothetical protein
LKYNTILGTGKTENIMYTVIEMLKSGLMPEVIVLDLSKASKHMNYSALEMLKNGIVNSSKYECKNALIKEVHIYVFANRPPDYEEMSADRWNVKCVGKSTDLVVTYPALKKRRLEEIV